MPNPSPKAPVRRGRRNVRPFAIAAALLFVIGFPMLAFGDAQYRGPSAGAPASA